MVFRKDSRLQTLRVIGRAMTLRPFRNDPVSEHLCLSCHCQTRPWQVPASPSCRRPRDAPRSAAEAHSPLARMHRAAR